MSMIWVHRGWSIIIIIIIIIIDNQNRMRQSDIVLEKYWVTQSGYFRIATIVALCMGIADGKLIYCHDVSERNVDKKISTLEYNNKKVY